MIKAVIFDYGRVLIKILPDEEYLKIFARAFGVSLTQFKKVSPPYFRPLDRGLPEEKFWPKLAKALKRSVPEKAATIFVKPFLKALVFYPEVFALVRLLRQKGIKTAVLSNNMLTQAQLLKERGGYQDFDEVILSCWVGLRKPDPAIYKLTARRLAVKCTECLFIDDNEKYLIPAKKLGMQTILAKNPQQVVKEVLNILSLKN